MSCKGTKSHDCEIIDLTETEVVVPEEDRTKNDGQTVIDLSFEDSSPGDDYTRSMMQTLVLSKRKRKRLNSNDKIISVTNSNEVIDVCTQHATSYPKDNDKETSYKQALGPMRMAFVSKFIQNPVMKTTKLYQELLEYQLNLPIHASSSIFVRALESRLDLLRIAITGPEGTPYENGVFLFDCYLQDYPRRAPRVQFLTTGGGKVRFNPNLYNCGKVCLSLLGTWSGPGWVSNQSTLLQVLTSIQALVLVPDPYFNEPGFHPKQKGAAQKSETYNRNIRKYTLLYAMRDMLQYADAETNLYSEWSPVIRLHFRHRASRIQQQLQEWVLQDASLQTTAQEIQKLLQNVVGTRS